MRQTLLVLLVACATTCAVAQEIQIGSQAELWAQRNRLEKLNFLEGMCEGLQTSSQYKLGDHSCDTNYLSGKNRFCFAVYINEGKDAIAYLDRFYRNKDQTEIPYWAAIAAYNDISCKENTVTSNLSKMQRRNECQRQYFNMALNKGVGAEAKKAQEAYCKNL